MQEDKEKYTVLLLSAPIGSGHKLAAEAIKQTLEDNPQVNVIHGNIFDFFPKFLGQGFLKFYLAVLRYCPWLYQIAYSWGNSQGGSLWLRSLLNRLLAWLGRDYLKNVQPDAVIATHATPAGIISCYKKHHPHLWLGAVITDFTIHRWWVCDGVDTYFVADALLCEKIKTQAEVIASGIPLRKQFLDNNRQECRRRFNWRDEEKICLLLGGGEGLLPMEKIIRALRKQNLVNLKIIAITGHNKKLEERLRAAYSDYAQIYGFCENVPQMMSGADMIISKAGGLTSAEVLVSDLDFIIYKPLPGQEQGNAKFLSKYYGAFIANNKNELVAHVTKLCGEQHTSSTKKQGNPLAATEICQVIFHKLKECRN